LLNCLDAFHHPATQSFFIRMLLSSKSVHVSQPLLSN